jgi:hypothetical protein
MKLKYIYILPIAYLLFFLVDKIISGVISSITPIQWWLLDLFLQVWLIIYIIFNALTGVILRVFGIEPGIISVLMISLGLYFILGAFLDFYKTLLLRRNA